MPVVFSNNKSPKIKVWSERTGAFQTHSFTVQGLRTARETEKADYAWNHIYGEEDWFAKWHANEAMKRTLPSLDGEVQALAREKVSSNEALLLSFSEGRYHLRMYQVTYLSPAQWAD